MIDIKKSHFLKYILYFNLYFIQGVLLTISWVIVPLYFVELDIPVTQTSLIIGISMVPWSVKFFWGGVVDYFIEHGRKKFTIIGGILFAFSVFLLTFINPSEHLILFTIFLFISTNGAVLSDVGIDAWAIQESNETNRGKIAGSMFAGQNSGRVLCSVLFTYIAFSIGYSYVFLIGSVIIFIISLFPILFKEDKISRLNQKIKPIIIKEFKKRQTQLIAIFSSILIIPIGILIIIVPIYLKVFYQLSDPLIGLIISVLSIATIIGSLSGGAISDKLGRKKALIIFVILSIIFMVLLVIESSWFIFAVILFIIWFIQGNYDTISFALLMDITNPKISAIQFSILTGIANLGVIGGNSISGSLISIIGFSRSFLFSAWCAGPALLILYFIKIKSKLHR
jgi:MFS family permease